MQNDKRTEADTNKRPLRDNALVSRLPPKEYSVYIWLLQAYSVNWIAETLGLEKRTVKNLSKKVYAALNVDGQRELIRYYLSLEKYAAYTNSKTEQKEEDIAYSMACYTNNCIETYSIKKTG